MNTIKQDKVINVRQFLRDFAKISNEKIVIYSRNEPKWVYIPYDEWENKSKTISIKEIKKFFIKGPKDLGSSVNDIYLWK